VAGDDFDNGIFEEEQCNQNDDKISLGSETDEGVENLECDEGEEEVEDDGEAWGQYDFGNEHEEVFFGRSMT
jgi:hypothetical protein